MGRVSYVCHYVFAGSPSPHQLIIDSLLGPTDWFASELIAALALSLFAKTDKFAGSINTSCHSFLFPFMFPAKYVLPLTTVICYVVTFLINRSNLL